MAFNLLALVAPLYGRFKISGYVGFHFLSGMLPVVCLGEGIRLCKNLYRLSLWCRKRAIVNQAPNMRRLYHMRHHLTLGQRSQIFFYR